MLLRNVWLIAMVTVSSCSSAIFDLPEEVAQFNAEASYNNKVDIIFMIDNSSSMLVYQNRLSLEAPALIQSLNSKGLDYRIAVTSSDLRSSGSGGRLLGSPSFLDRATPQLVEKLKSRLVLGQSGSDIESGLGSIKNALSSSAASDFLRTDALLAIVVLSNEDDYSLGQVSEYRNFLEDMRPPISGFDKSWIFNFIGVLSIEGNCRTTADFKEAGLRYMQMVEWSEGYQASICDSSLSQAVSNLEKRLVQVMSEFKLNQAPLLSSIRVTINDQLISEDAVNGWTYQVDKNSIIFNGKSLPNAFDRVRIDFSPAGGN